MILMKETTEWDEPTPNHTYCFARRPDLRDRNAVCLGYILEGTDQRRMFAQPLKLDLRKRTFQQLK
jgi:hypothetical protein